MGVGVSGQVGWWGGVRWGLVACSGLDVWDPCSRCAHGNTERSSSRAAQKRAVAAALHPPCLLMSHL